MPARSSGHGELWYRPWSIPQGARAHGAFPRRQSCKRQLSSSEGHRRSSLGTPTQINHIPFSLIHSLGTRWASASASAESRARSCILQLLKVSPGTSSFTPQKHRVRLKPTTFLLLSDPRHCQVVKMKKKKETLVVALEKFF